MRELHKIIFFLVVLACMIGIFLIGVHYEMQNLDRETKFCESKGLMRVGVEGWVVKCLNEDGDMKYFPAKEARRDINKEGKKY